ncbi:hypothetical protein B0H34DRAFT_699898 [Crassisporium funariophilum]|nr:hypothetical protein B0H34DRAFT_699898 [Crassisporium funariophilum]
MSLAIGIWSLVLEGGKETTVDLPADVRIQNITFGEFLADTSGRTVVKLTYDSIAGAADDSDDEDDEAKPLPSVTTVLCALTPGKIEQASVDLILDGRAEYIFQATGTNTVYLSGNYIDQTPDADQEPFGSEFGSDEDAYDLREVSSDVEMHPDDLDGAESDASRFEEVDDEANSKTQKRPRESDEAGKADASKSDKKSKKLKAEGGKAVPVEAEEKKEKKKEKKDKKEKASTETTDKSASKKTIAGGIVIQDSKVGTGPMAKKGNTVRMRYIGKLTNGKEFDKNTSGKPFTFHLGKGEVIKGWDEGIVGMQVGGERILTIPGPMAYGKRGTDGIPSNATLIFGLCFQYFRTFLGI